MSESVERWVIASGAFNFNAYNSLSEAKSHAHHCNFTVLSTGGRRIAYRILKAVPRL